MSFSLSFCAIVKNEENNLAAMLESISQIADEIIIVDTGSTDNTIKIAEKFNTKIFNYQWNDSFSNARNFAIEQATGDWIFSIDADERLMHPENLKKYLSNDDDLTYSIKIFNKFADKKYNFSNSYNSNTRLFRNHSDYKYFCSVHEQLLKTSEKPFQKKLISDCYLLHLGYDNKPEIMIKKRERNKNLIFKDLEKNEESLKPYLYSLLAREYLADGDYSNAIEYLNQVMEYHLKEESLIIDCATKLLKVYFQLKNWNKLAETFMKYHLYGLKNPDFAIYYGLYLQEIKNKPNEALMFYYRNLNFKPEKFPSLIYSESSITWKPLFLIGCIYLEKKNFSRAINYLEKALEFTNNPEIIYKLAEAYISNSQKEKFQDLIVKFQNIISPAQLEQLNNSSFYFYQRMIPDKLE